MSAEPRTFDRGAARAAAPPAWWRTRGWGIVGALSVTETVSWGIVYYAFAVFLVPMQRELGLSTEQLTGAFSVALLISAVAGIAVGRYLDRHSPRALMTAGSVAATALVLAWSQIDGVWTLYALWAALGLVMAVVLYEPAFTVLAKWFPNPPERRHAMTALTLVAALASLIFLPLSQALIDAHGWRDALVVLAVILGTVTIPLHALVLRKAPDRAVDGDRHAVSTPAGAALRSAPFWLLSAAFFLASLTGIAMTVHAIPYLLERGEDPAFAAFAVGLIGISQIPGRMLFALAAARLPRPLAIAAVFATNRRGRGASGDGTPPHTLAREVDDARAVLAAAGPGAALIGHSFGGAVALETARSAAPDEIRQLVLCEPGVRVAGLVPPDQIEQIEELVVRGRLEEALNVGTEQLDTAGLDRSGPITGRPPEFLELARTLSREIRAVDALGNHLACYSSVTVPTLLLIGAASPPRQQHNCQALAAILPDVQVERLGGQGHVAHNAAPDEVVRIIGPFLDPQR